MSVKSAERSSLSSQSGGRSGSGPASTPPFVARRTEICDAAAITQLANKQSETLFGQVVFENLLYLLTLYDYRILLFSNLLEYELMNLNLLSI